MKLIALSVSMRLLRIHSSKLIKDKGKIRQETLSSQGKVRFRTGLPATKCLASLSQRWRLLSILAISLVSVLHSNMVAKFAVVGGAIDELVVDDVNDDALYRDDAGHVYILPENDSTNTPILITEQGRDYADGILGGCI